MEVGRGRRRDERADLEKVAIFGRLRLPGRGAGGLNEPKRRRSVTRDAAHSPVDEGTAAPVKCSAQWHWRRAVDSTTSEGDGVLCKFWTACN